jgi:3-hydroxyisobutyrate dehydrogenase-like beta-hydroxyacid dehydrogenase
VVVGIVSPGAMGSGFARALRAGDSRVVATVRDRSERTRRLAETAGAELLESLDDVVSASDLVMSIVPPAEARAAATAIAEAARRVATVPLLADLNAISPSTAKTIEAEVAPRASISSTAPSPGGRRATAPRPVSTSPARGRPRSPRSPGRASPGSSWATRWALLPR